MLRPELAAMLGAERFLTEIKTTANLHHPHILPLFDSGEADGFLYFVMPFIEGETLASKLAREKQLGIEEAVRIAMDVADALDYAHRHDVIHRDIKPANILLHDGRPVVADFGIALAVSAASGGRMTETGLSLGTPHYMCPEQASADRDLSVRSDVYALGCVLYEMVAGEPPHTGPSAQAILVRILTEDPTPLTELRHTVPRHVAAAVAKAIEKLPADRFETANQFMEALGDEGFAYQAKPPTTTAPPAAKGGEAANAWNPLTVGLATLAVVLAGLAGWGWFRPPPEAATVYATRLPVDLGWLELGNFDQLVVSPDGSRFAVTGIVDGERALYWRSVSEETFHLVQGTEGAQGASFSPEGDWIAFGTFRGGLEKVSLSGGAPVVLVRPGTRSGLYQPHWGDDGTIVFFNSEGTFRIPDTGGEYEMVPGMEQVIHPYLLPGGGGGRQSGACPGRNRPGRSRRRHAA